MYNNIFLSISTINYILKKFKKMHELAFDVNKNILQNKEICTIVD